MLCNLYINHYIGKIWQVEGFAIYNLVKRMASFIMYPLLIGAGIGIPRYISFLKTRVNDHSYEYLLSGFIIFFASFLVFLSVISIFPSIVFQAFEQTENSKSSVIFSTVLFILSQGLYVLLNSYYRGRIQVGLMSLLNILIMSILPLFVLFTVTDVFTYFYFYSLATLFIVGGIMFYLWFKVQVSVVRIKLKAKRLFKFGYPRVIADMGLFSLEFMPIFLTSLYIGLEESGYLSMTFILLKLAAMFYELIGSLILPYFGKLFKTLPKLVFIAKVNQLLIFGVTLSVVISLISYFFIPVAIRHFFSSLEQAILPSQMVFIAFPMFTIYLLLRNILDIVMEKAYNSINLSIVFIIQFGIMVVGLYLKNWFFYGVLSVLIPYFVLGLLTYRVWINVRRTLTTQ